MGASPSFTFEQIEGYTGRAKAFAIFVTYAQQGFRVIWGAIASILLAWKLRSLVRLFCSQRMEKFTKEQADDLFKMLQPLHSILIGLLTGAHTRALEKMERLPIYGRVFRSIRRSTDDVEDILEDLALLHDKEFQGLVRKAIDDLKVKSEDLETVHN